MGEEENVCRVRRFERESWAHVLYCDVLVMKGGGGIGG